MAFPCSLSSYWVMFGHICHYCLIPNSWEQINHLSLYSIYHLHSTVNNIARAWFSQKLRAFTCSHYSYWVMFGHIFHYCLIPKLWEQINHLKFGHAVYHFVVQSTQNGHDSHKHWWHFLVLMALIWVMFGDFSLLFDTKFMRTNKPS